jgi:hypothetical protein
VRWLSGDKLLDSDDRVHHVVYINEKLNSSVELQCSDDLFIFSLGMQPADVELIPGFMDDVWREVDSFSQPLFPLF